MLFFVGGGRIISNLVNRENGCDLHSCQSLDKKLWEETKSCKNKIKQIKNWKRDSFDLA